MIGKIEFNDILDMLAREPRGAVNDDPGFWTDGNEILCPTKHEAEVIREFLTDVFSEHYNYDFVIVYCECDDKHKNKPNCRTGFYYVTTQQHLTEKDKEAYL